MTLDVPARQRASASGLSEVARSIGAWTGRAINDTRAQRRRDRWLTLGIGVVTLAVYMRSLLPGIGFSGDVAKWQYMSQTGGIPHPTGYPLWVALIQAWSHVVPLGTPAWRTGLLSAVIGAAAITVLFRLLRVLNVRRSAAAATALTFAVTPTFWSQASVPEVYTLHILFMALVTLCLARWRLGASNRWLLAGLGILALSLGHHAMTVLAVPGVAWLVWSDRRRAITRRNVCWVVVFAVLAACQYLYLFYMTRVGGYVEVPVRNLADLIDLLRGGEFQDDMWAFSLYDYLENRIPRFGEVLGAEYLILQTPIAYGIWRGLRSQGPHRDITIHLAALGLLSTLFATGYDVFDIEVFFIPLLFVLAVFLGLGLEGALYWADTQYPGNHRVALGIAAGLVALPLVIGLADYRRASQRGNFGDADRIEHALHSVNDGALFVTDNYADEQYFLYYLLAEGYEEDHDLAVAGRVSATDVGDYLEGNGGVVAEWIAEYTDSAPTADPRPVYTASPSQAEALEDDGLRVTELGDDLWRVRLSPEAA